MRESLHILWLPGEEPPTNRVLSLESLPEELLQLIVSYLPTPAVKSASLVSSTLYRHATDVLWENVCLVDRWRLHSDLHPEPTIEESRGTGQSDEHDDGPIIGKLFILATNPIVAAKVRTLTHRCHLPTPNIFDELPRIHFHSETLSRDPRLHALLKLAIRNLVNVHTLRIVHGHMNLASLLVAGFLDQNRTRQVSLRKLWLENCCLSANLMRSLSSHRLTGLESLRIRRVDASSLLSSPKDLRFLEFRPTRGGMYYQMHDGSGNWAPTTVQFSGIGMSEEFHRFSDAELMAQAKAYDDTVWQELSQIEQFVAAQQELLLSDQSSSASAALVPMRWLLEMSAPTLTSLNLDWVLWRRDESDVNDDSAAMLKSLATLRFPHLRAFQFRNAVLQQTMLPGDVFLFEDTFLEFMEYHQKLQCLAWPMDKFYSHLRPSIELRARTGRLIAHLANMLIDLRVDAQYEGHGEAMTDGSHTLDEMHDCFRRRRFIAEFVPHMRRIESIKIEGGVPRDEKREVLRALHWCPLKKIVMIGVSYPIGNTWGAQGRNLKALDQGSSWDEIENLEEEDYGGMLESYRRGCHMLKTFEFEPEYGWPAHVPLLQTIALHHASQVEELKICGYNGCPILSQATPITAPLLTSLRQFDNLKQLVMSFWLLTWHEGSYRDTEIINYWKDSRSPASTALVVVTPPRSPMSDAPVEAGTFPAFQTRFAPQQDFNRWAVALKTSFSPSALAYRVARDIGPYLSPIAKSRPNGVRVRASFCLGMKDERRPASDIFDLDVRIGSDDQVLQFTGPREEMEKGRFWQKLETRKWF
ncbi:hypothetical protein HBH56_123860 [Parastagonospora nodorum]|uniref:F-box domain-containing protein n=1 Tax=Phaeosphaeria nodorum (strain SN15 / ATCC MYA-4574 / FGSC 10173) TaxID=321614 RepID=A0A7U2EU73_PHANO|nr:hypothetical protein HBH56_123860 [Parastagonospora nodorum]QRC91159.1 hypothetical protein JI435_006580 [Parastagonospora nodorum SN15]KAH3934876.1 hypothetical protein HBH54_049400 [Parastagonospora nodorum]KAH4135499.1 hypothetical protein HBH45_147680 [Parastagonospora nodorum]KAH4170500.1 hypothetical protein HBH44_039810 [Parastagonospora nodorum]